MKPMICSLSSFFFLSSVLIKFKFVIFFWISCGMVCVLLVRIFSKRLIRFTSLIAYSYGVFVECNAAVARVHALYQIQERIRTCVCCTGKGLLAKGHLFTGYSIKQPSCDNVIARSLWEYYGNTYDCQTLFRDLSLSVRLAQYVCVNKG